MRKVYKLAKPLAVTALAVAVLSPTVVQANQAPMLLASQPPWWMAYTHPNQMNNTLPAWFNNWQEYQAWRAHWWNDQAPTTLPVFADGNWWNNLPANTWGNPWATAPGWNNAPVWNPLWDLHPSWWGYHSANTGWDPNWAWNQAWGWNDPWNAGWNNAWNNPWNNNWNNQDWINDGNLSHWHWMMGPININTASSTVLRELPSISAPIATRIINARPFTDAEQLLEIQGITISIFQQIRPFITW